MVNEFRLDLSPFSDEMKLLFALSGPQPDPGVGSVLDRLGEGLDWKLFVQLARHHRVYPSVYLNLKRLGHPLVPAAAAESLNADYTRNTFQMFKLTAEMDRVCKSFDENRVRSLMLKGPILAETLYGELAQRTCKDLDILVSIDDLERAAGLLAAAGYEPDDEEIPMLNDWKWRVHHISYTHPVHKVQIELHWRLNPDKGAEPAFDELWERRNTSKLTNYPVAYLGDEDMFFFLTLHGARHGWFRLRWLADIDRMVRKTLDWSAIQYLMRKYDVASVGGQALILATQMLGSPVRGGMDGLMAGSQPGRLAEGAIAFMKDMITLSPVPRHLSIYYRRYLFSLRSPKQKGLFLISQLYPNNRDLETLPLPKPLYVLYFPLRPLLWFWRRMKQQASS